jgi:hypothetical protein
MAKAGLRSALGSFGENFFDVGDYIHESLCCKSNTRFIVRSC